MADHSPTGRLTSHEPQPQQLSPPKPKRSVVALFNRATLAKNCRIAGLREKYGSQWQATLVHFGTWEYSGRIYGHFVEINPYCAGVDQWDESTGTVWQASYKNRWVGSGVTPLHAADQAALVLFGEGLRIKPGDLL